MKHFFNRVGNKRDMINYLKDLEPIGYKKYVEPFVGSGAVFWSKAGEDIETVINDNDERLMEGYRLLQFGEICDIDRFNTKDIPQLTTIKNYQGEDDACKLAATMVRYANTFAGKEMYKVYKTTNPFNKLKKLADYRKALINTEITCKDYIDVVNEHDSAEAFLFIDPPYVESSAKMYEHDSINIIELHSLLSNIQGKFILTLDNIESNRELFKNFRQEFRNVKAKNRTKKGGCGGKDRIDLVVLNY
tara:strand:+ start:299 stop:1039 length:741 start_codon:yes stop_codon:yes gene_type:complete